MYFWKYRLRKISLDKCLKSCVSDDPYTDNKASGSKYCCTLMAGPLQYLLISVKVVALEKVSFGDKQNPKGVC